MTSEPSTTLVARVVRAPFVYPDGQVQVDQDIVREPQAVELDGNWLHIVEYDSFGASKRVKSYPASEIQLIDWTAPDGEQ